MGLHVQASLVHVLHIVVMKAYKLQLPAHDSGSTAPISRVTIILFTSWANTPGWPLQVTY